MTASAEHGTSGFARWYHDRAAWRFVALRYAPFLAGLSLAWEVLHLPLYTLWAEGAPAEIAFAVAHCTAGDVLIGLAALLLSLIATRAGRLADWRWRSIAAVAIALGVGYTAFSEWLNTSVREAWAYSDWMPVLSPAGVGASPLLQWLVVPALSLWLARRAARKHAPGKAPGPPAPRSGRLLPAIWSATLGLLFAFAAAAPGAAGDAGRGAQAFRACAACHSMEPGRHLTGPSLATVFGRKAATVEGFGRYSEALRASGVTWDADALDAWLRNPAALVPGNLMTFRGIADADVRADLIAYLRAAAEGRTAGSGDGGGMMRSPRLADLKNAPAASRVRGIRHCGDTYYVTTGDGRTAPYWEFNLRFKTDSSDQGPRPGEPVMVGQGMMGDRAQIVFAQPREMSAFISSGCP